MKQYAERNPRLQLKISPRLRDQLAAALAEDLGRGDATTDAIFPAPIKAGAALLAREPGVFCGAPLVRAIARLIDPPLRVRALVAEGHAVANGDWLLTLRGDARSMLKIERLCLNFVQRLSGIATLTRRYVEALPRRQGREPVTKIYDTRKTTPLWRELERYAVRAGGGANHRFGLYDAVLIKNNHVDLAGGMDAVLRRYAQHKPRRLPLIIEARNLREVRLALAARPDVILLDNMSLAQIRRVRAVTPVAIALEVSGGVTPRRVAGLALLGIPRVSVGALTHSARALDISLRVFSERELRELEAGAR